MVVAEARPAARRKRRRSRRRRCRPRWRPSRRARRTRWRPTKPCWCRLGPSSAGRMVRPSPSTGSPIRSMCRPGPS
ncbi:hypothetical protein D0T25_19440 [Duganella sp. BJB488]|nr:hypothetical protein D0T26_20245 [Duganella sp. BJB489]RFP19854.1 hypothetical protein D0T25_19440 [Duganella sp. BJB488]RFP38243.1 hypothetical protein D0T24_01195 [Duganella sp. BJB480]